MITLDGSLGEGGGQIVRTSLALSLITGKPFHIENIRRNRRPPCLRPQHCTAVEAAAEIGHAQTEGVRVGAREFSFTPGRVEPGKCHFDIGTAGSTTLLLQTVLPPLMTAAAPSNLLIRGGTHNTFAPPFDFLERSFLPLVRRMGPRIALDIEKYGFYPKGGGRLRAEIEPVPALKPFDLRERGAFRRRFATAIVAGLERHIAERELEVIRGRLDFKEGETAIEELHASLGPANIVMIEVEYENVTEVFTAFGRKGVRAESVAQEAVHEAAAYLASEAPAGPHLADQLLLPMALAGEGSFRATKITDHFTTNAEVIGRFVDIRIKTEETPEGDWIVTVTK